MHWHESQDTVYGKAQLELTMRMTPFVMSHFSYSPFVWLFHDRKSNNKINKIHERALRIIHKDTGPMPWPPHFFPKQIISKLQ